MPHRLGTSASDRFSGEDIRPAFMGAAAVGYRHFDLREGLRMSTYR